MRYSRLARDLRSAHLAIGIYALLLVGAAGAQEPLKLYGLTIPDRVAGLPHEAPVDYEKTNPGLGTSVQFIRPGWRIDVYIYDVWTERPFPDDPRVSPGQGPVERGAARHSRDASSSAPTAMSRSRATTQSSASGTTRFVCLALQLFRHNRRELDVDSHACVSAWNNKFIKIRMTARLNAATAAEARSFVEAWIDLLWPSA